MMQMNLFTKTETDSQIYVYQRGKVGRRDKSVGVRD